MVIGHKTPKIIMPRLQMLISHKPLVLLYNKLIGFAPALIGATFSTAIFLNGLVAILAGIVANISVSWSGSLAAPFVVSAGSLILAGLMISNSWEENFGESKTNASGSVLKSMLEGLIVLKNGTCGVFIFHFMFHSIASSYSHHLTQYTILSYSLLFFNSIDANILSLGLAQTVFECSMYTFVLLYTPALEQSIKSMS